MPVRSRRVDLTPQAPGAVSQLSGTVAVVDVVGRFDSHTAPEVARALDQALSGLASEAARPRIVVNLQEVQFMDSSALATLVQGLKRCRQAGGDLRLCNLQQPVRIIFELTRLDKAFDIYPSEAEALSWAADQPS